MTRSLSNPLVALATVASLALGALAPAAMAQGLDFDESQGRSKRDRSLDFSDEVVREIVRGVYVKAAGGSTIYLMDRASPILRPGTTINFTVGQDVVDKPKLSAAWEVTIYQALHNGLEYERQGALLQEGAIGPNRLIQGNSHNIALLVGGEVSGYVTRRFGIGGRLGGGVMISPLLMNRTAYDTRVIGTGGTSPGEWGGPQNRPTVHERPLPVVYAGPTFEYYTKLSHFSLGIDIDAMFAIGMDLGIVGTGYFKYTF